MRRLFLFNVVVLSLSLAATVLRGGDAGSRSEPAAGAERPSTEAAKPQATTLAWVRETRAK